MSATREIPAEWRPEGGLCGPRGPVPQPSHRHHSDLLPEIHVLGGEGHFAHDAGTVYDAPSWYVAGQKVANQEEVLPALLLFRGVTIPEKYKEAAQVIFNYTIGWRGSGAVFSKPDFWDRSAALKDATFFEPYVEVLENPTLSEGRPAYPIAGTVVARVHLWSQSQHQTYNPHPSGRILGPRGMDMGPAPVLPQVNHWTNWHCGYSDFLLAPVTGSQRAGLFLQGGGTKVITTTPDGLDTYVPTDADLGPRLISRFFSVS